MNAGRFLFLSLSSCLFVVASLAQGAKPDLRLVQQRSEQFMEGNHYREAAKVYRAALTTHPEWRDGWWMLGTLAYDNSDFRLCQRALSRYLSLNPGDGSGWALKGLAEFELAFNQQSLADLRRADGFDITSDGNLQLIANVHELLLLNAIGDFEGGFKLVQKLSNFDCTSPLLVEGAGLTALRIPMLPKQVPPGQQALVYRAGRAVCEAASNRWAGAHTQFASLVNQYPALAQLHYLYGCFLLHDHPEEGLSELTKALQLSKSHVPAMTQVALEYLRRGQASTALGYAEHAVAIAPHSAQAQYAMGKSLIDLRQIATGVRHLRQAESLSPKDRNILWALADGYSQAGNASAARAVRAHLSRLDQAPSRE